MGILTLYGAKKKKKNSRAYMGILTLYGAKKHKENSHMFSIKSFAFMDYILPKIGKNTDKQGNTEIKYIYGDILNTSLKEKIHHGKRRGSRPCFFVCWSFFGLLFFLILCMTNMLLESFCFF
jgi:hypothetical protein